jgi:hypothetical protein
MGIRELRQEASALKIKNYSKMKKAELEAAVEAARTPVSDPVYADYVAKQQGRRYPTRFTQITWLRQSSR